MLALGTLGEGKSGLGITYEDYLRKYHDVFGPYPKLRKKMEVINPRKFFGDPPIPKADEQD